MAVTTDIVCQLFSLATTSTPVTITNDGQVHRTSIYDKSCAIGKRILAVGDSEHNFMRDLTTARRFNNSSIEVQF